VTDARHLAWFRAITPHFQTAARQVAQEIAAMDVSAPFQVEAFRKSAVGWAEHDGQIVHMTDAELALEERDEIIDLIVYRAARLARGAELDRLDRGG